MRWIVAEHADTNAGRVVFSQQTTILFGMRNPMIYKDFCRC